MAQFTTNTGMGYIMQLGKIVAKYELPIGTHQCNEGYSFFDVNSKAELDAVVIYKPVETKDMILERLEKLESDVMVLKGKVA